MEDYRMKQLLEEQLKYDKAKYRRSDSQNDSIIARELQNLFNQELAVENPSNLVYDTKTKKNIDNSKSLVDPSWELIDPTPNIHNLFMAFNQQYFWNKLLAVCVSWSKRMTTCAGICAYQPQAGMCHITLSEPLLKLRPRKDLVQTLLHEMIHAFLFVTHNNRDRDGHGPEFHKHMNRINGEAGTNITVYHSFHDEVRLYQQHWWKCNGPCQHRKPYFGMIRRASNRAPGPNDRWWAEHTQTCGGTFIKVKEPEKKSKTDEKENAKPKVPQVNGKVGKIKSPPPNNADIRSFFPVAAVKSPISTTTTPIPRKTHDNAKIQNINGFQSGEKGSLELQKTTGAVPKPVLALFNGIGKVLSGNKSPGQQDYSAVRNHWLDKLENKQRTPSSTSGGSGAPAAKRPKLQQLVPCPVCNLNLHQDELNAHLDTCLNTPQPSTSTSSNATSPTHNLIECDICDEWIDINKLEEHKERCIHSMSTQLDSTISQECPICKEPLCASIYDSHVASCVMKGMDNAMSMVPEDNVNCLVCKKLVPKSQLNQHLDECMTEDIFMTEDEKQQFLDLDDSFNDSLETSRGNINNDDTFILSDNVISNNAAASSGEFVNCPVCQVEVAQQLINAHLDNCLG